MTRQYKREAPELAAMMDRMMAALVRRAADGEAEAVEALAHLDRITATNLTTAVRCYRSGPAEASWADVAGLLGVSRQAAHRRHAADDDVAEVVHAAVERAELAGLRYVSACGAPDEALRTGNPDEVTCLAASCVLAAHDAGRKF